VHLKLHSEFMLAVCHFSMQ